MLVAIGLNWSASVGYYVVFVWFISNVNEIIGLPYQTALGVGTFGLVVGLLATLGVGHLSDFLGPRRMLVIGSLATALFSIPLLLLAAIGTLAAVIACAIRTCHSRRRLPRHFARGIRFAAWPGVALHGAVGELQHGAGLVRRHRATDSDASGEADGLARCAGALSRSDGAGLSGARALCPSATRAGVRKTIEQRADQHRPHDQRSESTSDDGASTVAVASDARIRLSTNICATISRTENPLPSAR